MKSFERDLCPTHDKNESNLSCLYFNRTSVVSHVACKIGSLTFHRVASFLSLLQPVFSGLDVFKERPKLRAWRDRVQAFIGKELFDEAHEDIMNVQEKSAMLDASALELWKPMIFSLIM